MTQSQQTFSRPIPVDLTQFDGDSRNYFLRISWRCHREAYGEARSWSWNHFVEKSTEYPFFIVICEGGEVVGYVQASIPCPPSRIMNIGSIAVRKPNRGIGRNLIERLWGFCREENDYILIAEVLENDVNRFEKLFSEIACCRRILKPEEIVARLSEVRRMRMDDRLDFFKGTQPTYRRHSPRRNKWENRILLEVASGRRQKGGWRCKGAVTPLVPWPPVDYSLGRDVAKYLNAGKSISVSGREGPVLELEKWFEREHPGRMALSFSSGTIALQAAFFAAGLKPGDRVLATVYSYHATVSPLLQFGVHIDFVDVEPDTGNISVTDLGQKITASHKLLVTNHMWGHPVNVSGVEKCLRSKSANCLWVEDCSHALFSEYRNKRVGTFGHMAVFSLQANKILPAGEGGILLAKEALHHDRATCFAYSLERTGKCLLSDAYRPLGRTGFGLKHRIHPLGALVALHHARHNLGNWIQGRAEAHSRLQELLAEGSLFKPMTIRPYVTRMGAWYGYKPSINSQEKNTRLILLAAKEWGLDISKPGSGRMDELPLFKYPRFFGDTLPNSTNICGSEKFTGAKRYLKYRLSFPTFHAGAGDPVFNRFIKGLEALENCFGK